MWYTLGLQLHEPSPAPTALLETLAAAEKNVTEKRRGADAAAGEP